MHTIHYSRKEYREEYLQSPEWKEKSGKILRRDKTCRVCEKSPSSDAHHLTYERIGFENLETDLIGVCRKCHNRIHKYHELKRISNLRQLKKLFQASLKSYVIDRAFLNQMLNAGIYRQQRIAGLLKIPISHFSYLFNRKISFFLFNKIQYCLDKDFKIQARKRKNLKLSESRKIKL